jgi:hypothetical protein
MFTLISGFVDDSDSVTYCSSAADFDAAQTEMASKYTAAASIFSFLWMGYESAVQASQPHVLKGVLKDGRLGERGRRLVDEYSELFPGITGLRLLCVLQSGFVKEASFLTLDLHLSDPRFRKEK